MSNELPLISIGMPLYNAEKHIRQSLDSLLRQTHTNFEIIISDNCSTDDTVGIVQTYAARDSRIKIFQQPKNIGPIPNFQFVLQQARGDYFMWRSYDDWSDDNYLETLGLLLDRDNSIDLAVANIVKVKEGEEKPIQLDLAKANGSTTFSSSLHMLKISHPGWMYGLFRRQVALNAINDVVENFPHVWGWDHLILFPTVSRNRVGASSETRFFQRETGISHSRYRPKLPKEQVSLATDFYRVCLRSYQESDAPFLAKLAMVFYLLRYTSSKTEKFTRILRIALKLRKP
ncbi:glycosyltransferase family 2 protein [uncultured Sneathiella sp.]|uniref:glycosyltransferase family 2 protein n=1 Tax=uncultured Sneathiella sp. TaxID=879315 RepID=UPI00259916CE|nr:glycosyltransferase family 2 protein [uncultured Sneathiella sp.]